MNKSNGNIELNYAYVKSSSSEIHVANISLVIGNEQLMLVVEVNETITNQDFELLLESLQNQTFNKMRLSIAEDCNVVIKQPIGEFTVSFETGSKGIKIVGLIPVER